jgi:hypothetical protein
MPSLHQGTFRSHRVGSDGMNQQPGSLVSNARDGVAGQPSENKPLAEDVSRICQEPAGTVPRDAPFFEHPKKCLILHPLYFGEGSLRVACCQSVSGRKQTVLPEVGTGFKGISGGSLAENKRIIIFAFPPAVVTGGHQPRLRAVGHGAEPEEPEGAVVHHPRPPIVATTLDRGGPSKRARHGAEVM